MASKPEKRTRQRHASPRHSRGPLDRPQIQQRLGNILELFITVITMEHLTTTEKDRKLHLMPLFEKLTCVLDLDIEVVLLSLGTQPDLLERCGMTNILLIRLSCLALLLIQPLAVIHNSADGRIACGSNFYQVKPRLQGLIQGLIPLDDTQLIICFID